MLTSGGGGSYGDDLINPTYFPCKSATLDTSLITGSGDKVAAIGTQVLTTTQAAETSWKGLQSPGVFETPDSEVVYALMQPAVKGATDMNGVTGRLSTALHTYAAELEAIKPDLADLEERATKFRERAQKGYEVSNWEARGWLSNFETGLDGNAVPRADADEMTTISWKEHGPARDKNESLLHEYDMILERISAAATTCANAIQRELKMVCVAPAEKITAEMIAASDLSVWGKPVEEQRNCTESVGHGLGNFWHNTWTGAASLIGRDATTGEWSWETAGKTWWGVGDFALSTVIVTMPTFAALQFAGGPVGDFYRDRQNVAASSWGGLIGWDHQAHLAGENGWHKYEEDGVAALTESVANVGTFFIPVAGAAAGGTKAVLAGTRVGSFVAKTASHVAEFVVPAGSYLVKGAVKVIDLGVDLTKGGWRGLVDALTPGPVRPNVLPGITGVATEASHVPLPSKTPVSSSLGLEGAPAVHGSTAPGGGHVPDGSAPHGGLDGPGEVPGRGGETNGGHGAPDDGGGRPDGSGTDSSEGTGNGGAHASDRGGEKTQYDPAEPPRNTVNQSEAPQRYKDSDVQEAYDRAPVDEQGRPVDHRTGEPLRTGDDGRREWYMKWDQTAGEWVAENPGLGRHDPGYLPPRVSDEAWLDYQERLLLDPGAKPPYGYDANGDRLPYANHRPPLSDETVRKTWWQAVKTQILGKGQDAEIMVQDINGNLVEVRWESHATYRSLLDDYRNGKISEDQFRDGFMNDPSPLPSRDKIWDMGHLRTKKYSDLLEDYLNHEIDLEDFKGQFNDSDNYQVENPLRNRSHADEIEPDLGGEEF